MHPSGSFLRSVIEKVRVSVDEPASNAKFTDDILTRLYISSAWAQTFSMMKLSGDSVPVVRLAFDLVADQYRYLIPAWVDSVVRVVKRDERQNIVNDWVPAAQMTAAGPGWKIEGNEFIVDVLPYQGDPGWEMLVIPSGDFCLHLADGTNSTSKGTVVGPTSITLSLAPYLGLLDRRPNVYAGQVIRILETGRVWQERVIKSYDAATRLATVWTAFDQDANNLPANGQPVSYEIAPLGNRVLWDSVAWKVCQNVGASRKFTRKDMEHLEIEYQRAMKGAFDRADVQKRISKYMAKQTVDNRDLVSFDVWAFSF